MPTLALQVAPILSFLEATAEEALPRPLSQGRAPWQALAAPPQHGSWQSPGPALTAFKKPGRLSADFPLGAASTTLDEFSHQCLLCSCSPLRAFVYSFVHSALIEYPLLYNAYKHRHYSVHVSHYY